MDTLVALASGNGGASLALTQALSLVPGQSYKLEFAARAGSSAGDPLSLKAEIGDLSTTVALSCASPETAANADLTDVGC